MAELLNGLSSFIKTDKKTLAAIVPSLINGFTDLSKNAFDNNVKEAAQQFSSTSVSAVADHTESLYILLVLFSIFLFVWCILLILKQFTTLLSQEQKDNINYIHNIIFGGIGVIPIIFMFWMVFLVYIMLIPVVNDTVGFIGKLNNLVFILLGKA